MKQQTFRWKLLTSPGQSKISVGGGRSGRVGESKQAGQARRGVRRAIPYLQLPLILPRQRRGKKRAYAKILAVCKYCTP